MDFRQILIVDDITVLIQSIISGGKIDDVNHSDLTFALFTKFDTKLIDIIWNALISNTPSRNYATEQLFIDIVSRTCKSAMIALRISQVKREILYFL